MPPNPARPTSLLPLHFLGSGWRHRRLIGRLTRSRVAERYRGSLLGGAWVLVLPLLMLGVYTFVFSEVFRARWDGAGLGGFAFALRLFAGMLVFGIFAECANEAPGLLHANQNYIKQVLFPTEILAWVSLLGALWRFAMGFLLLVVFQLASSGWPPVAILSLPLTLVPLAFLALGTSWLFSSLGVFLRDLAQVVTVFTSALLFLSPVFYPASRVPESLRPWFQLNPFATILENVRAALFEGRLPDWRALGVVTALAFVFAWVSHAWFLRAKSSFADVL
jgi:lipopolysaccharide transport system permease protein